MIAVLFENLGWKLFSLAVAIVLWMAFVSSPELVTSVSAPIAYQRLPQNLDMIADANDRVHLEIQGPSARLQGFDLSRIVVVLDAGRVDGPGERTFGIRPADVKLPVGLKLIRAVPSQIRVQFDRHATGWVPVRPRFSSQPPPGYKVRNVEITPPRLRVGGPESRVKNVEFAQTDPIDLAEAAKEPYFSVNAFLPDPQVRFESSAQVKVRVFLEQVQGAAR